MTSYLAGIFKQPTAPPVETEYGDASLEEKEIQKSGIWQDIKAMGPNVGADVLTLVEKLSTAGEPHDDKSMLMERLIKLVSQLPETSKTREKISHTLIGGLWDSLQHPPQSYYGDEYKFRSPDGSHNNIISPDIGKAGQPYARTCRPIKAQHGAKPDPGLLFDLLMAREDGKFRENPAGISSILFYHATIIIHDIFRTNRKDQNISDTSSYLDLAPLYGSSENDQDAIRAWSDGKIKPDTFSEHRLLGQPPGVCVLLVMYSRFHNYVAENLAAINDGGRFTKPREGHPDYDDLVRKRDNDLFQTARLVVGGLYINISLHDYIRGITNIHHSNSTWTLDPRVEINKSVNDMAVDRGVGNQCSVEFNLLYRFHSATSQRDSKWTKEFFQSILGDKDTTKLTIPEFLQGVGKFEAGIPKDPAKRTFGGLVRDPQTGKFNDEDLVRVLKESIEDPAGAFGARNVPKHLRVVEIIGILQARRWQVCTLNEFRQFFNLKKHDTFESINNDKEIADTLRKLYDHPDLVELYPGLFVESAKERMDPGSGFSAPYTVGRAVLSDAVTLVRGDRFYTTDYNSSSLTAWGYAEVQQDYKTLGGSMLYKLIQRAVPGWFKFNSVYVMQPMYTPKMNLEIAKELGTLDLFSPDPPSPPRKMTLLNTHAASKAILNDQKNFKVKYGFAMPKLVWRDFMLSGDNPVNVANHKFVHDGMWKCPGQATAADKFFKDWFENKTRQIFARESYKLKDIYQVDLTKDIARVVVLHFHSELLNLPMKTKEEPDEALTEEELYKLLVTYLTYVIIDSDPAESWNLRRQATEAVLKLKAATEARVTKTLRIKQGFFGKLLGATSAAPVGSLKEVGQNLTISLSQSGLSLDQIATTLFTTASGGVSNLPSNFVTTLDWFLLPENASHWEAVKELAKKTDPASEEKLKRYVLEGQRLSSALGITRLCFPEQGEASIIKGDKGEDIVIKRGEAIVVNATAANRDPKVFPDPDTVRFDRDIDSYVMWGMGPHWCVGRDLAIIGITSMIKVCAQIKGFRRAADTPGQLKWVPGPFKSRKFLTDDWSRYSPFAQSWKVQFDDF